MSFTEKGVGSIFQGRGGCVRSGPRSPALTLLLPAQAPPPAPEGWGEQGKAGRSPEGLFLSPGMLWSPDTVPHVLPPPLQIPRKEPDPFPSVFPKQGEVRSGAGGGFGLSGNKTNRVDFSSIKVTLASGFGR